MPPAWATATKRRVALAQAGGTAHGSLHELHAQLKLAAAWGYVPRREVEQLDAVLDRVAAMTWRRLHRAR